MREASIPEILSIAKELVSKGWCQNAASRDKSGNAISNPKFNGIKCSFCAVGAINEATIPFQCVGNVILKAFSSANKLDSIVAWNDHPDRTQEEVIAAFDKAINHAKSNSTKED